MRRFVFAVIVLTLASALAGYGQVANVQCTQEKDQQTLSVSGNTLTFPDSCGTQTNTFELVISGSPITFNATLSGVMRGGTTVALASTSTNAANQILQASGGPYDKYTFTATWSGGGSPSVLVNRTAAVSRHGVPSTSPFKQGQRVAVNAGGLLYTTVATLDATAFSNTAPTLCTGNPVPLSADWAGNAQATECAVSTSAGGVIDMRGFDCSTTACNVDSDPTEDPHTLVTTTKVIQMFVGRGTFYVGCTNGQGGCNHTDTVPVVFGVPTKSELWGEGPSKTTFVWNGPDPHSLSTCDNGTLGGLGSSPCPAAPIFCMGGGFQMPNDPNRAAPSAGNYQASECTTPADDNQTNNPRVLIRDVGMSCSGTLHVRGVQNYTAQEQSGVQRYSITGCANGDATYQVAGIWIQGANVQNSRGYIQGEIYYGQNPAVPCSVGNAYGFYANTGGGGMGVIIGDLTVNGSICTPGGANLSDTAVYMDGLGNKVYGIHVQGSLIGIDLCATANPCTANIVENITCTGSWNASGSTCVQFENSGHPASAVITGIMNSSGAANDSLIDLTRGSINAGSPFGQKPFSNGGGNGSFMQYAAFGGNVNGIELHALQGLEFQEQLTTLSCPASGEQLFADTNHRLTACYNSAGPYRVPLVIFNSSATMGTTLIAAAACSAVVTVASANVLATDAIAVSPNAAPTAGTDGSLILWAWPTSGNVNFKQCNPTAAGITPAGLTVNYRVMR